MEKMAHFFSGKTSKKAWLISFFPILLILLLGFFLRIYKIHDYIIFLGDEGRDVLVAYEILHGNLTLLGPTSSVGGFFLGPIYYYFMTPFLWLSNYDPVGPAVMVVLFGVATIYLVYRIGKEFFGKSAGLIASLLYAVSPIVILYSRSSWNPNVFPFFTLSSLYTLYKAVLKNKPWLFVLSGFLMGINLQIHYLATFVGGVMFFYVTLATLKEKNLRFIQLIKRYVLMLAGFLIGFSPFLAFEVRHQFANSQNILRFIFNSPDTGAGTQFVNNIKFVVERLFGGLLLSFPKFENFGNFDLSLINYWSIIGFSIALLSIGFFLYLFAKSFDNRERFLKYLLILVWFLVGIGLFGLYKKSIYDYYLGFLFPLPFLLLGAILSYISPKIKPLGTILVIGVVVILVSVNLYFSPLRTPGNRQVNQIKSISKFILDKTNNEPYNFALSGSGNSDHAYRYFFKLAGKDPVVIQGLDSDPERKSVTDQLFIVCEKIPCSPLGESSNNIAGFGRAEIAGEWKVSVIKVYKLVHYSGEE